MVVDDTPSMLSAMHQANLTFIMPDEIRQVLPVSIDPVKRDKWQQTVQAIRGAINLYGAIEMTELMRQIDRLPVSEPLPVSSILSLLLHSSSIYCQSGPWLTSTAYCRDEKELLALLAQQKTYPYRKVKLDELMLYADDCYVARTDALANLEYYLLRHGISADQAADAILLVVIGLRRDEPYKVLNYLLTSLALKDIDQLMLMRLIHTVAADVRSIRLRGHTAREHMILTRKTENRSS